MQSSGLQTRGNYGSEVATWALQPACFFVKKQDQEQGVFEEKQEKEPEVGKSNRLLVAGRRVQALRSESAYWSGL